MNPGLGHAEAIHELAPGELRNRDHGPRGKRRLARQPAAPNAFQQGEPIGQFLQEELLQLMERQEERKTMVFITHSIDEAILLGDRMAVMTARPGRIKEMLDMPFGRPRDVETVRADPHFAELRSHIWRELHTAAAGSIRAPREVA